MSKISPYNDAQWAWVAERYREGYTITSLSAWLGVHRETVRRHLMWMGYMTYGIDELDPLDGRREEFLRLGGIE